MTEPTPLDPEQQARINEFFTAEVEPRRAASRQVGESVRELIDRLVATTASIDDLAEVRSLIDGAVAKLAGSPRDHVYDGFTEASTSGDPHAFFDNSPLLGRANPLAPPIRMELVDGAVVGHVRFGVPYQGAPGCVHGGFVAAAFDEVLGLAQSLGGSPGMTGTLTTVYRSPTPLHVALRFEGRLVRVEGRKLFTEGTVHHGDTLCAEAEAVFITVDFARLAELDRQRREREASGDQPA